MLGAAGATAVAGIACLIVTAVAALALTMDTWIAALIVAVVLFAGAAVLAMIGKNRTGEALPPMPEDAIDSAREDIAWIREEVRR